MPRFIVRPKLGSQAKATSGSEGAQGAVIVAETASKAREIGAKRLNRQPGQVEVIQHEDAPAVITGPDRPLTREEAEEIFNQETSAIPGSWEPI